MQKIKLDVIGDPIEHSKSPIIHETVLCSLGLEFEYRKVLVKKGELEGYLDEVRAKGISGFNLTMPHKKDIIKHLDYIDDEALLFDSVNTIKVKDGKLFGYNTDGRGCVQAIFDEGYLIKNKNIVILGAGGVVSTVALKMQLEGAKKITILNRTPISAHAIAEKLNACETYVGSLTTEDIVSAARDCDILINATPLGMSGIDADFNDFSFLDALKDGALVYDLIYNPPMTTLLKEAKKRNFNILNGLNMLIFQGLLADNIFLERSLDFPVLKEKIQTKLKNF